MRHLHRSSVVSLLTLFLFVICLPGVRAQEGNREARIAQWDSYALPAGAFVRHLDKARGIVFWRPADWKEEKDADGSLQFIESQSGANIQLITETIPDGYGVANYTTATLQQFRRQRINQDSATVRHVTLGGIEGREIVLEIENDSGEPVRESIWLTAVGPLAIGFIYAAGTDQFEQFEPYFKRMMMSVRIYADAEKSSAHWNDEFEALRTRFVAEKNLKALAAGYEVEAARIAQLLSTAQASLESLQPRVVELVAKSPDAAFDLMTDVNPQVRAAAITAFGKSDNPKVIDALLWAMTDKDPWCVATAARALAEIAANPERKAAVLAAIKDRQQSLSENPTTLVNLGVALGADTARLLLDDLLNSNFTKGRAAGLHLATVLPLKDVQLPWAKLLESKEESFLTLLANVARLYQNSSTIPQLTALLKDQTEVGAATVLGEIGTPDLAARFEKRVKEIDARLEKITPQSKVITIVGSMRPIKPGEGTIQGTPAPPPPPPPPPKQSAAATARYIEQRQLAELRGALEIAASKIKFRDAYTKAKDEKERREVYQQARADSAFSDWADNLLPSPDAVATALAIDPARFKNAPTTGETLFPQDAVLYLMSPNPEQTLTKFNDALNGVQMETVRDQMTFALLLNTFRAQLISSFNAEAAGSISAALGIDLTSPVAAAEWKEVGVAGAARWHSAMVMRVGDRARFEQLLGLYQSRFGSLDSFTTVTSLLARFAGALPAAAPLVLTAMSDEDGVRSPTTRNWRRSGPFTVHYRQEEFGNLPITIVEKTTISVAGVIEREQICVAYFGNTAVIAPSRAAMFDLLGNAASRPTIASSAVFKQARNEIGEVIFFSQLDKLYQDPAGEKDDAEESFWKPLVGVFAAETGALRLSPTAWETVFRLKLPNNDWAKSFRLFNASDLSAPRDLLPRSTVLYVGAMFDAPKLLTTLKTLEATPSTTAGKKEEKSEEEKKRDQQFDRELDNAVFPNLHGEAAFAVFNLAATLKSNFNKLPGLMLILKLKNNELAKLHRAGKLFASAKPVENAVALGSPVATLPTFDDAVYFTVTDEYLILADSVETLKLLEAGEKFATTRDYLRSTENLPGNLAMFMTYSLDAAMEEARQIASKDENSARVVAVFSALVRAFHSQRAFVAVDATSSNGKELALEGRLAVSFGREGRYVVGKVGPRNGEFDIANALIAPKGRDILNPTRLESLRLKVIARQPGIVARVRDDLSKFTWQKADSTNTTANDTELVYTTSARRIPDDLTITLPVTTAEVQQYLRPTPRINSTAPEIVNLAKEIAAQDEDGRSVARKLGEWTYNNLKWKKVESTATQTLASREADCFEHSELYVALARALGLPARVVTGAAFGGGSFGAHAWVEIWLGQWVEVDPTWGLMDYVDATHLRFDGDGFISYAMLNQVELEVLETRSTIAEFQRDPIRLIKEFSAESSEPFRTLAFDATLAAQQTLGAEAFARLNDKQRVAVLNVAERASSAILNEWVADWDANPSILESKVAADRATILAVVGYGLLRFHLAQRDGAWYITEVENLDEMSRIIGEQVRDALAPLNSLHRIRQSGYQKAERGLGQLEKLIAAEGERPELLLLKATLLESKEINELINSEKKDATGEESNKPKPPSESELLRKQITTRWPDFAPAWYALAQQYNSDENAAEKALEAFRHYAKLMPLDPRPWAHLAENFVELKRFSEAETAYREAIARDRSNYLRHVTLANFYLNQSQLDQARTALSAAFAYETADDVFTALGYETGLMDEEELREGEPDKEQCRRIEELLLSLPQELSESKAGLRLLVEAQDLQDKYAAALKTMQRVLALGPEAYDYIMITLLHRNNKKHALALTAANQALKLDEEYASAHYYKACALAQLGRRKEAITALKRAIELSEDLAYGIEEEEDLKPLTALPAFKALIPKPPAEQPKEEKTTPPKQ